ncbi:alcohol dehydrogenase catalytic domain-containing protein [Vibrio paucivorans]|uniref:Alcohol dehydrogenase catalytic domain-containing protein n=1 Tax=Vibrio paucivorans TaxID=2829489 RepID=A0A9X3CFI7_9VIBR|nr:alcohol dehydrogenase catalytic domain-containing protein [Vibrio paucivorans]MCW8334898.1 alcohol dehydrogenase catalytic domain-containing protein [Vibrio paucivorans]
MNTTVSVNSSRHFSLMKNKVPKISDVQTLVKIHYAGICGTDKQFADGTRALEQSILGHEAIGSIVAQGRLVLSECKVGDLVVFRPHSEEHPSEILGHNITGVFSEYIVLDNEKLNELTVVCDVSEANEIFALTEPLAASIFSLELLQTKSSIKRLGIIGLGSIGCLIALTVSLLHEESEIFCFHNNENIEHVKSHIFNLYPNVHLIDMDNLTSIEKLKGSLDSLVICTSKNNSQDALKLAVELSIDNAIIDLLSGYNNAKVDVQGTIIDTEKIRGRNVCGNKLVKQHIIGSKSIYLTGHRGVSKSHMKRSLELLKSHQKIYSMVISNTLTPNEAVELMNRLSNRCSSINLKNLIKF